MRRSADADVAWNYLWNREVREIKYALAEDIAEAFSHNRTALGDKARWMTVGLLATAAEVSFVGLALIWFRVA